MEWIDLSQERERDRYRWWALVNAEMKLWVPKMPGISWLGENRLASLEGLYCME